MSGTRAAGSAAWEAPLSSEIYIVNRGGICPLYRNTFYKYKKRESTEQQSHMALQAGLRQQQVGQAEGTTEDVLAGKRTEDWTESFARTQARGV